MLSALKGIFTYSTGEIRQFHAFRTMAIITVIWNHFTDAFVFTLHKVPDYHPLLMQVYQGQRGFVDLFFIISGFLIGWGLVQHGRQSPRAFFMSFYIKRLVRIFPAYYLLLAVSYLMLMSYFGSLANKPGDPEAMAALNALLAKKSALIYDVLLICNIVPGAIFHLWALALEMQFYLLFPLFAWFVLLKYDSRRRIIIVSACYALFLALRIAMAADAATGGGLHQSVEFLKRLRFDSMFIGILIMEIVYHQKEIAAKLMGRYYGILLTVGVCLNLYGLAVIFQVTPFEIADWFFYNIWNIGWGLLVFCSLKEGSILARVTSLRIFLPMSRVSYTMYLWHVILAGFVTNLFIDINTVQPGVGVYPALTVLLIAGIFILSIPLYLLVEYPSTKLKDWIAARLEKNEV